MLKVLIADDERKIGLLIRALIRWEELGLEFLDLVQDGQQAYEIILEKKPDIVITDIRMPRLSGLELIQKAAEEKIAVHFIVISGYRYFEYAQTALKYGVEDYLLKPIEEEELHRILYKIVQQESSRAVEDSRIGAMEKSLIFSRHILHRELLERVTVQGESVSVETINQEYGVKLESGFFRAAVVKVDRNLQAEKNQQQEKLIMQNVTDKLTESFEGIVTDLVISTKTSMETTLILNYKESAKEKTDQMLHKAFYQLQQYIGNFEHYEITMGISPETTEFSRISYVLEMAREAIHYRIFKGTGIYIDSTFLERNSKTKANDILKCHMDSFINSIQIVDGTQLEQCIRRCFETADKERMMGCEYYQLAGNLVAEYCEQTAELFSENMEKQFSGWREGIDHCHSPASLVKYLYTNMQSHLNEAGQRRKYLERKPVLDAIEMIRKNYGKKILLEEVADNFGFHPNYFSEIFKNETGKNFSSYLLEVRMEAAKNLLRNGTKTIYEVAEEVGYKDSRFFSQQFVKTVGIKPTQYRKLYF